MSHYMMRTATRLGRAQGPGAACLRKSLYATTHKLTVTRTFCTAPIGKPKPQKDADKPENRVESPAGGSPQEPLRTVKAPDGKAPGGGSAEDQARVDAAMAVDSAIKATRAADPKDHGIGYTSSVDFGDSYNLPHPLWQNEYVWRVKETFRKPANNVDKLALLTITVMRFNFDWMSGWLFGKPTVNKALNRIIFLETVAGIPGSIAGILRHLASLRRLRRDNGWIHTLFEEAENERMHLLTYLELKKPNRPFRTLVWLVQGIFYNFFFFTYLVSPRFCHRLVGYLEEQAVTTYTHILHEIDHGSLKEWQTTPAPEIAITYWKLRPDATMRDVVAVTRADEAHHRDVNHAFSEMKPNDNNPFKPGY